MLNAGDVVWLDFPGAVKTKRRPAVVLSTSAYHAARPDVILGLITSQIADATGPTDHLIKDWRASGLRVESAFRAFIVTVPQSAITRTLGHLSAADWQAVRSCVLRAIHVA